MTVYFVFIMLLIIDFAIFLFVSFSIMAHLLHHGVPEQ